MKLQPDRTEVQTIAAYGPGWVVVEGGPAAGAAGEKITGSVVLGSRGERLTWAADWESLTADHFAALARMGVEVVIFGSGATLRFPKPAWLAPLAAKRIGIESMDTAAACRTYNILAQEGRVVAVALLL
ncbi:MAG TPA: MTH938/NDUFAF3 family protein [Ramlibacter sp.]|uniref:Mth938-like domain-containing protein n=1 Tax=Ramlibacter sp. TaxID=1917967 RepID=UPI002CDE19BF|nr:MTH938/NDUFAF3 family protein [Ramlibacter sp.]HVZ44380.1 MTH938/NDUFAF3 family protein [Ramlibacter sp.]